jgi:hypothetical protein
MKYMSFLKHSKIKLAQNITSNQCKGLFVLLIVLAQNINILIAQISNSSFLPKVDFAVGSGLQQTCAITSSDFNGDGKIDIATSNQSSNTYSVFVNNSTNGVINSQTMLSPIIGITGSTPIGITAVDLDSDNKPDLITSNNGSNTISVYRNTTTSGIVSFTNKTDFISGSSPAQIVNADLDLDGKKDIISCNFGSNTFSVFRNTSIVGSINFANKSDFSCTGLGLAARECAVSDVDLDGKLDVVVLYYNGWVSVFRNTSSSGSISFASSVNYIGLNLNAGISVEDIDGDGKSDIAVSAYNSGVFLVFKNNSTTGTISFSNYVSYAIGTGTNPHGNALADLDDDGKPEFIVCNRGNSTVSVYRNFGSSGIINSSTYPIKQDFTAGSVPIFLELVDIDNDGKREIITANNGTNTISILKNNITPSNGLVAYYKFDGNAADSSGFNNNGSLGSGASAPVLTIDRFGNPNSAYYFDGTTDIITVAPNVSLRPTNSVSVAVWIKSENKSNSAWNFIMTYRHGPTSPYDSYKIATFPNTAYNNRWSFGIGNQATGNQVELLSKQPKQDNIWMHIAVVYDGSSMKFYTNGLLDTSINTSITSIAYGTGSLAIGNSLTNAIDAFKGAIDDLRIYNRAISLSEIKSIAGINSQVKYYSKSTGSINQLSTWGTNPDGSGTSPLSFDSSNTIYNVVNGNTSLSGNFRINGAKSVVVFGNGISAFNFPIAATDTLSADSVFIHNSGTLTVSGTLQTNKLNSGTSSTVQYIGSAPQLMAGGIYENIAVASSTKTMSGNVNIRGALGMVSSINCNNYELTLGINATTRGTLNRSNGSIIGRFSRWYTNATNTGTTGLYPIGTATKYTPIQIEFTSAPSAGGKLTCEFVAGTPGNVGLPQFDFSNGFVFIDKAAAEGVVRYTSTGITGGSFTATFTANNYVGISNYTNLRLLYRNIGGNWTLVGNATSNIGSNTSAIVSRTGLSNFSGDFGIGGDQLENPMPVKLTQLQAKPLNDNTAQVKWQTAYEYNSAKFVVQRSMDKVKWSTRGEVKSQGNSSSTTNYQFSDDVTGLSNTVYYRLVQVDLDGTTTTSKTVSVVLSKAVQASLQVYPNPANDKLNVTGLTGKAIVYDITGKQQLEILTDGEVNIAHLPAGIYFLRSANETVKIVKH